MYSYIVIPCDRSFTPTSTLAEFVGTATDLELTARFVAELDNPRYAVADCEDGDRIDVDASPHGWQIRVRSHRGHLTGGPGIVLSPLHI